MINITCNINEFLSNYKKKTNSFIFTLQKLAYDLAVKISQDMRNMILKDTRWEEEGNMSDINDVTFRPEILSNNMVRVHIGENLPLIEMSDGTLVNPAFFIEFGFGIVGEQNPKENHENYGWDYNINDHKDYWFFKYNGELLKSKGREGINFMYITMQEYAIKWKAYFYELLARYSNV